MLSAGSFCPAPNVGAATRLKSAQRDETRRRKTGAPLKQKGPTIGPIQVGWLILGDGLSAEASRRDIVAVSADDPAGYGIKYTSRGADEESAAHLPYFLITQKARAAPAEHA